MRLSYVHLLLLPLALLSHAFTNPVKSSSGADPFVVFYEGYYYLLTTTVVDIQISRASTIEQLKSAEPRIVWTDTAPERCCCMWAPELHRVSGRWFIYYTAGSVDGFHQRMWVIQGSTEDPLASPYTFLSEVNPPNHDVNKLDGTVWTMTNNSTYFIYSAWTAEGQTLWISPLLSPSSVGPATLISIPTYGWETVKAGVNEGPIGISHGGRDFLFFSASHCETSSYELGFLSLEPGRDPLDATSWEKAPEPAFTTANGVYGPGHNSFFKSPDGTEDWIAFHANQAEDGTCDQNRQTYIQRVDWEGDQWPRLGVPQERGVEFLEPSSGQQILILDGSRPSQDILDL